MKSFPPLGRINGLGKNFGPIVMSVGYILISLEPEFHLEFLPSGTQNATKKNQTYCVFNKIP